MIPSAKEFLELKGYSADDKFSFGIAAGLMEDFRGILFKQEKQGLDRVCHKCKYYAHHACGLNRFRIIDSPFEQSCNKLDNK